MRLLVVVAVAVVVAPTQQVANPQYQYYGAHGGNLRYGYSYPQYQAQSGGSAPAALTYLDAYGQPALLSHPAFGLGTHAQRPVATVGGPLLVPSSPASVPNPALVPQHQYTSQSEKDKARSSLSPLLKLAVDAGFVHLSGSSHTGYPQYAISNVLAEDAGSVSGLASRFDALPVAAVHDVQMPPNRITNEESFLPVLIHKENPQATLYTLEVPTQ